MKYIALVPSYQPVEDQLIPLLQNLLSNEFSVVLVNDGSKDKSAEVCSKLADTYKYVKFVMCGMK